MRLLDLFCGAGGATAGYQRAGFHVTGVDIASQPNYCGDEFHQADVMSFGFADLAGFDVIHASPPCQRYSAAAEIHDSSEDHPDLIAPVRQLLAEWGRPWIIENVERAPLLNTFALCGSMFGLGVRRHRCFESNMLVLTPPCGAHSMWHASVFGGRCVGRQRVTHGAPGTRTQTWDKFPDELGTAREAMDCDWMTLPELSEAIPPAYTEWIGTQLLAHLSEATRLDTAATEAERT